MAKKRLYTTDEVAEIIGVSTNTLRRARCKSSDVRPFRGPQHFKDGGRVFYAAEDLEAWIAAHRSAAARRGSSQRCASK